MRATLAVWLSLAALAPAQGSLDLSEVLARPLDPTFAETGGASFLTGAFDAHRYAVWLAPDSSQVTPIEDTLRTEGFARGYGRTWSQPVQVEVGVGESRVQYMSETVEEFQSADGAQLRLDGTRSYTMSEPGFEKIIEPVPDQAFGAIVSLGSFTQFLVSFRKGNDVYVVEMESGRNDMTDKVVMQARSQFDSAPAYTIEPAQWRTPVQNIGTVVQDPYAWTRNPFTYLLELGSLIVVGGVLVWVFDRRRRSS